MAKGATLSEATSPATRLLREAEGHRPRLEGIARRVLKDPASAEDVVQDVLTRLAALERAPASLPAWLTAVTYRRALDLQRQRARRAGQAEADLPSRGLGPYERAAQGELAAAAQRALQGLDEPYRTALTLRYSQGLSFAEIAERMEAKERTTRTWVGRGLERLRRSLAGGAA